MRRALISLERNDGTASPPVLILAPLGADAGAIAREVAALGLDAHICAGAADLAASIVDEGPESALLVVITQEGATAEVAVALDKAFSGEPEWARLPVVFLISDAHRPPTAVRALDRQDNAPPFVVLDRPVAPLMLRKVVEALAEARRRQFATRDLLRRLREEEEQRAFLLSELRHRTHNSLAVLQSLFSLSVRSAADLETFAASFSGRLRSLADAHARLANEANGADAELRELLQGHVLPYASDAGQLRLSGPRVTIGERSAFNFALAIHELATNAAKYGALSRSEGRVEVEWSVDAETQELAITWRETGGPPVSQPEHRGLGRDLVERFPPPPAQTELRFDRTGVVWTTRLPPTDWERAEETPPE